MKKFYLMIFAVVTLAGMLAISGCKKKETYTVTFNPNGGGGTMAAQIFTEGEAQALTRNAFTYYGYTFTGWNTVQGGNGTSYTDGQTITATADMTLYAQWTSNGTNPSPTPSPTPGPTPSNTVTVTFDANGGTGEMAPQTFTVGVAQALSANTFTRENQIYSCWNTSADGSGTTYRNSQEITISESITLYAQWYESVDLGLPSGTRWAPCNVGATNPEDYGNHYAWGEIAPKENYLWENYRFRISGDDWLSVLFSKYNTNSNYGTVDNLTVLELSDDVASVYYGEGWRMPTDEEFQELIDNSTVIWTSQNGINGCLFTGPNGNSIFMPAAADITDEDGTMGKYWTNLLRSDSPYGAWSFGFSDYFCNVRYDDRRYGFPVRAVCASQN